MMDRNAAAQISGAWQRREAEITHLSTELRKAKARIVELEQEAEDLKIAWGSSVESYHRTLEERETARRWAVRLESELEMFGIALFSSEAERPAPGPQGETAPETETVWGRRQ